MRLVPFIVPTIVAALTAWSLSPATPQEPQDSSKGSPRLAQSGVLASADQELRVAILVRQLGSASYRDRLAAERELSLVGVASRKALEAAAHSDDAEVRLQAGELLKKFQLDDLWTAGHVSCRGRGEPASKVIAALAEQTGNHLLIGIPYGTFKDATLDLDYPSADFSARA